jgi:glucosamine--fructose-6-phosphate aminotransferase (isomerizing)
MTSPPAPRTTHPYYMHDAIVAQPGALRSVLPSNAATIARAAERLRAMEHVILCGIGTSWHAALVGELLLARSGRLGHRVRAMHSFELASSWPPVPPETGVIAISHRGGLPFAHEALARAGSEGVAISVTGRSPRRAGDGELALLTVDQEIAAAHTVSYTTALALLAALADAVGGGDAATRGLARVPDQIEALLHRDAWVELARRFGDRRRYWFVGGGPNTATAYEAALKMTETNYATATGINCEQFLHGVYTAMTGEDVLVLIAPPGPARARCLTAARAAKAIGTPVLLLADDDDQELKALAVETIALPAVDELLSPIVAVVPLQLFAYHLAVRRGVNPDTMRAAVPPYARARELVAS